MLVTASHRYLAINIDLLAVRGYVVKQCVCDTAATESLVPACISCQGAGYVSLAEACRTDEHYIETSADELVCLKRVEELFVQGSLRKKFYAVNMCGSIRDTRIPEKSLDIVVDP